MEGRDGDAPDPDVLGEILSHLARNPSAADTPLGIWQWWLSPQTRTRTDVQTVETALEHLVRTGRLGVRVLSSGVRLYCRDDLHGGGGA